MSLIGSLEDLALSDILQIVNLSRKSGVLVLKSPRTETRIVFQDGEVISAYNPLMSDIQAFRPVVEMELMKSEELGDFVRNADELEGDNQNIVSFLLETKEAEELQVHECMSKIVSNVILDVFTWREGHFNFELRSIEEESEEIATHPLGIVLQSGINPQFLSMEGARLHDEKDREEPKPEEEDPNRMITSVISSSVAEDFQALQKESEEEEGGASPAPTEPEASPMSMIDIEPVADSQPEAPEPETPEPPAEAQPESLPETPWGGESEAASTEPTQPEEPPTQPDAEEASTPPPVETQQATAIDGASALQQAIVYLIDDDGVVLKILGQYLLDQGLKCKGFTEIAEAMESFDQHPEKESIIVLADLLMPRIDQNGMLGGIEVLEIFYSRALPNPVVVMSDHDNQFARERAAELGVHEFLEKPRKKQFSGESDVDAVREFLEKVLEALTQRAAELPLAQAAMSAPVEETPPELETAPVAPPEEPPALESPPIPEPEPTPDDSPIEPTVEEPGDASAEFTPPEPEPPLSAEEEAPTEEEDSPEEQASPEESAAPSDDAVIPDFSLQDAGLAAPETEEAPPPEETPAEETPLEETPLEEAEAAPAEALEEAPEEVAPTPMETAADEALPQEAIEDALADEVEVAPIEATEEFEPAPAESVEETQPEEFEASPVEEAQPEPEEAEEVPAQPAPSDMGSLGQDFALELERELEDAPFLKDASNLSMPPIQATPGLAMLRTMTRELQSADNQDQIPLLILRFASELMNRAVLFFVHEKDLFGIGAFGIHGNDIKQSWVDFHVPLDTPNNLFQFCREMAVTFRGEVEPDFWSEFMEPYMGHALPAESFIAPILSDDVVVAILYGDNASNEQPIDSTDALEIFLAQAGLALNLASLERRMQTQRKIRERGPSSRA